MAAHQGFEAGELSRDAAAHVHVPDPGCSPAPRHPVSDIDDSRRHFLSHALIESMWKFYIHKCIYTAFVLQFVSALLSPSARRLLSSR